MPRKKSTPAPATKRAMFAPMNATPITLGIKQAQQALKNGEPEEAFMLLTELNDKYPGNEPVLRAWQEAALEVGAVTAVIAAQKELVRLLPGDFSERERLGQLYFADTCPALAVREWRQTLADLPDAAGAGKLRESLAELEGTLEGLLEGIGLTGEGAFEDACAHDTIRLYLDEAKFAEARDEARALLERRPNFIPARNNLAQALYLTGDFDSAVATVNVVLENDPENVHALSNVTRFLYLGGREAEARPFAERLKALPADNPDRALKVMEALSYLGDDDGVLTAFRQSFPGVLAEGESKPKQSAASEPRTDTELTCWHFAATALARLGDEAAAKRLWKVVVERNSSSYEVAAENLAYLEVPVGERPAPHHRTSRDWITGALMERFDALVGALSEREALAREMDEAEADEPTPEFERAKARVQTLRDELLASHPELTALAPALLDRCDPQFIAFFLSIADEIADPAQLEALRAYGSGQRGPDSERLSALQTAVNHGLMDPGNIRFFSRGEWTEVRLYGFQIEHEPDTLGHSEAVLELLESGTVALERGNLKKAEADYRKALSLEPDSADILTNIAYVLGQTGRNDEALTLMETSFRQHPDDATSRINIAFLKLRAGEVAEARSLTEPLLNRRKFHASELDNLLRLMTEIELADGRKEAAQSWLALWVESGIADENDPRLLDLMLRTIDIEEMMRQRAPRRRAGGGSGEPKTRKRRTSG
jgi:tetratricopeptide (TPR) repeat protein